MRLADWGRSHTVHATGRLRHCDLRSHCRSLDGAEKESFEDEVSMMDERVGPVVK